MSFKFLQTQDERDKESQAYLLKIFPFGMAQRDSVKALLNEMFPKYKDPSLFFHYLVAKEQFMDNKNNEGVSNALKSFHKVRPRLSGEEVHKLMALIVLELNLDSLDTFPSQSDVEGLSKTLEF